ncbi:hypothetical protein BpHYR1_041888 [Brachionus plicatilis]|uniref:Uncharacterized protein n=1 Tax=Brachionus plicatilis TaxID=10195 RepID=A0A3M7S188_BRAPC|nr:hypothetical protein BpHYR1_041888 [Brachionus plicatilis]
MLNAFLRGQTLLFIIWFGVKAVLGCLTRVLIFLNKTYKKFGSCSFVFCFNRTNFIVDLVHFLFHDIGSIPIERELSTLAPLNDIVFHPHQVPTLEYSSISVSVLVKAHLPDALIGIFIQCSWDVNHWVTINKSKNVQIDLANKVIYVTVNINNTNLLKQVHLRQNYVTTLGF